MAAIVDALDEHFPHSHSKIHDGNGQVPQNGLSSEPVCEATLFTAFVACFETNCLSQQTRPEIIKCIAQSCFNEFSVLSQDCSSCIFYSGINITEVAIV